MATNAPDVTDLKGIALFSVSPNVVQRGNLCIKVDGTGNLVIYTPADGQLGNFKSQVDVQLVVKGSPLLLKPEQYRAILYSFSVQIKELKQNLKEAQTDDLTKAMTQWAIANGFSADTVAQNIHAWAEEIKEGKVEADEDTKALAQLALGNYSVAAPMFRQVSDEDFDDYAASLQKAKESFQKGIEKRFQTANTYQLAAQYHLATQTLEDTLTKASAAQSASPNDPVYRSLWLETKLRLADARRDEAAVSTPDVSVPLLLHAIGDYRDLLTQFTAPEDKGDWAKTQNNLCVALADEQQRGTGASVHDFFKQAVDACSAAQTVFTKDKYPHDWAETQVNLGKAEWFEGERSSGDRADQLFNEATAAYRDALDVLKTTGPLLDWAAAEIDLGDVLRNQAERNVGAQATQFFNQAVEAYQAALKVYADPKTKFPSERARAENELGYMLRNQAEWSSGTLAAKLLAQARDAEMTAQDVRTENVKPANPRDVMSQDWAQTQNALGMILTDQAELTSGTQAANLLAQAEQDIRETTDVYTESGLPQAYAWAETNLGHALMDHGERSSGDQAGQFLRQAENALQAALSEYAPQGQKKCGETQLPQACAAAQAYLGRVLTDEAELSSGDPAGKLLDRAEDAIQAALDVQSNADFYWVVDQIYLARILTDKAALNSGDLAKNLLDQSADACRSVLQALTQDNMPLPWTLSQSNLTKALTCQAPAKTSGRP